MKNIFKQETESYKKVLFLRQKCLVLLLFRKTVQRFFYILRIKAMVLLLHNVGLPTNTENEEKSKPRYAL